MGQLYQAKSADIQADLSYRQNLANSVMQFANSSQQAILQGRMADNAQKASIAQDNLNFQRQLQSQALEFGQNGLIPEISAIDPSSPTFEQEIASVTAQLRKPVTTVDSGSGWEIQEINGVDMWVNESTREMEPVMGGSGSISQEDKTKVDQALDLKGLLGQLVEHPGFASQVGSPSEKLKGSGGFGLISPIPGIPGIGGAFEQGSAYLSGERSGFNSLYNQIVEGITVDQLSKMSGPKTDKDIEVLRDAAVRLNKSTSEEEFLGIVAEMDETLDRVVDNLGVTQEQANYYLGVDPVSYNEASQFYDTAGGTDVQIPNYVPPSTSLFFDPVAY